MKSLFKRIRTKEEADTVIKTATSLLYVLIAIKFFVHLIAGDIEYIFFFAELLLVSLLRRYRSRVSSTLLTVYFLVLTIVLCQNFYLYGKDLDVIIEFIVRLFLGIRAVQASFISHGRFTFSEHHISIAYHIYFWLFSAAVGAVFVDMFFLGKPDIYDFIDLPFTVLGFVGLAGYVFKKAFLKAIIWKLAFLIIILWDILYIFFAYKSQPLNDVNNSIIIAAYILVFCVGLPYYFALYRYGYGSVDIWERQGT